VRAPARGYSARLRNLDALCPSEQTSAGGTSRLKVTIKGFITSMNTTLVGVFKTASDARQAWCRLAAAGVSNTAIRLAVEEWPWDEAAPTERGETQEGRGAVKRFFLDLLDRVNDAASTWLRPELTDHFILTVDIANPESVEKMGVILDDCGAVDIDEQVEARASDSAMAASLGHLDRRVEKARSLHRLSDRSVAGESSTRSRKA
jgi:hypothetical protein